MASWTKGVFTQESSHWREDDCDFVACLPWWSVISLISVIWRYSHFDKIHVWCVIILHALPIPVHLHTDFTPKWVDVLHLHTYFDHPWMKFLLQYNITGLNADWVTRASMTFCGGIYHVNKCRAMRGNWSEPAWAGTKVIPVSCKLPRKQFNVKRVHLWYSVALGNEIVEFL